MIEVNMDKYKNILELLEDEKIRELEFYIRENKQLKKEINSLQREIEKLKSKHNSRGAGRKSKLEEYEKDNIFKSWLSGEFTIKELAEQWNCSTRTVDRILKDRREQNGKN